MARLRRATVSKYSQMNYFVYILRSDKDDKRYVGMTSNIVSRLLEHFLGEVKSTSKRRPLELIHCESFSGKREAMQREKFYKSGKGREYLKENNL